MATTKFTPSAVPFDAPTQTRAYLDEQMRRISAKINAVQLDDLATPLADRIAFLDEENDFTENQSFGGGVYAGRGVRTVDRASVSLMSTDADTPADIYFGFGDNPPQSGNDPNVLWALSSRDQSAGELQIYAGPGTTGSNFQVLQRWSQTGITFHRDLTLDSSTDGLIADFGSETDGTDEYKFLRVKSNGYAGIRIVGDWGNTSGEPGGAFVELHVDGEGVLGNGGFFSRVNVADTDGLGNAFTDASANSLLIGSQINRRILFGQAGQTNFIMRLNVGTAASFYIREVGNSDAGTVPGFGQLWVRSSDGALMFTDSSGSTTAIT